MSEESRKFTDPSGGNAAGEGKAGQDTGSSRTGTAAAGGRAARRPHGPHGVSLFPLLSLRQAARSSTSSAPRCWQRPPRSCLAA